MLLGSLATSSFARAGEEEKKKAKKLLDQGDALLESGDFGGALTRYQKAHEVFPNARLLLPMAKAEEKLGRDLDALQHLEQLVNEVGPDLTEALAAEIDSLESMLGQRIAHVWLSVEPEGAVVTLDDVELGPAPLAQAIRLLPGKHHLLVTKDGLPSVQKNLELRAGDDVKETVSLVKEKEREKDRDAVRAPAIVGVDPEVPERMVREPRPSKIPLWIGVGATATFAVAAVVTGLLAKSDHDGFAEPTYAKQQREDARGSGKIFALATDGLLLGTATAAALTAYWYYFKLEESPDRTTATIVPWVGSDGAGVSLSGFLDR